MLQCSKNPLRKESLAQFYKDCRRQEGSWFSQIFADLIGQWLLNHNIIPTFDKSRDTFMSRYIIPKDFSNLVQRAIADQVAIGLLQATRGFLAKTWMAVASTSFDASNIYSRSDGAIRIRQVLKALHHLTTALWIGRNSALHTSDQGIRLSMINTEIARYHSEPELLLSDDRFYCEQSLHRLLSSSPSIKRRWLHRVKRSREKKETMHKNQPRMTKFFRKRQTHQHHNGRPPDGTPLIKNDTTRSRTTTVQRLMTMFLHERASNQPRTHVNTSPPPILNSHE